MIDNVTDVLMTVFAWGLYMWVLETSPHPMPNYEEKRFHCYFAHPRQRYLQYTIIVPDS